MFSANPGHWNGIAVQSSPLAVTRSPRRVHKHRRNQTPAYHARVQKKWVKRFGQVETPAVFKMRDPWTGRDVMVMHPTIYARLRRTTP